MEPILFENDLIELKEGHSVYAELPAHFQGRVGNFDTLDDETLIVIGKPIGPEGARMDTSFFKGYYLIHHEIIDGGGQGQGAGDVFPSGNHVFADKVVGKFDPPIRVSFYTSGHFTAMIQDILPIVNYDRKRIISEIQGTDD